MGMPLFDDVLVDAVPRRDGPVRTQEGKAPPTAHTSARLSVAPFELEDPTPKLYRIVPVRHGTPCYFAYWTAFKRGADGQSAPGVEHDDDIARYARDGFRIGRLFRPLPCMKEERR